jgi:hypothetical protein
LDKTLIVYGTRQDVELQREAAELLQRKIARRWSNIHVPTVSEDDVTEEQLKSHHLLLIGRPAANSITAASQEKLPVRFASASFELRGETYAHPASAVGCAGDNPFNPRYQVVVYAGLSADATRRALMHPEERHRPAAEIQLFPARRSPRRLAIAPVATIATAK